MAETREQARERIVKALFSVANALRYNARLPQLRADLLADYMRIDAQRIETLAREVEKL